MDDLDLMTADEVAATLKVPKQTIYAWRHKGEGPPAARIGRFLRWRRADVEQWVRDQYRGAA